MRGRGGDFFAAKVPGFCWEDHGQMNNEFIDVNCACVRPKAMATVKNLWPETNQRNLVQIKSSVCNVLGLDLGSP